MGDLISPISFRLYNRRYWNNIWFVNTNSNFSFINMLDISILNFIKFLINNLIKGAAAGIIFNNLRILRSFKFTHIYIYIHDSLLDLNYYEWKRMYIFKRYLRRNHKQVYKTVPKTYVR